MKFMSQVMFAAACVATLAPGLACAQAQNVRVRGTIEKVDGNAVMVKSREGAEFKLVLKDNARVAGVVKARLTDLKPTDNVAITSQRRADGGQEAIELRISPAGQPFNSFQGDWDLAPNTTMTNGSLQGAIANFEGEVLTVTYKVKDQPDREQKIVVTASTIIATTVPATLADLKPGLKVFVAGAPRLADGSLDVAAIQVEKEIAPPQ